MTARRKEPIESVCQIAGGPVPCADPDDLDLYDRRVSSPARFAASVAARIQERLVLLSERYGQSGRQLTDLGSADDVADLMMAVLPEPSLWDRQLGPVVTTNSACQLLGGISRQALAERRQRRTLLALRTADGEWVYPRSQFHEGGEIISGLADVIQAFDPDTVDEWTVAGWLTAKQADLGNRSVISWLRGNRPVRKVLGLARQQAARYRR